MTGETNFCKNMKKNRFSDENLRQKRKWEDYEKMLVLVNMVGSGYILKIGTNTHNNCTINEDKLK